MITLAQPAWLLVVPLAAIAFALWFRPASAQTPAAQLVHPDLGGVGAWTHRPRGTRVSAWLTFGAACLIALALARPQWLGPTVPERPLGRDIVLLVDTSASMSIDDFTLDGQRVTRLDVLKGVARQFVAARPGDRFGLIAFGDRAATLVAPSFDQDLLRAQLTRLQVGIAGEATAIGDALGLALKQVKTDGRLQPALILFSDGDATAGEMLPSEALAAAQALGAKIYTVAIGTDLFASPDRPKSTSTEPSLAQLATATNARHYVAGDARALRDIIFDIGRLEPSIARPATQHAVQEWYWLPLLLAALLLAALQAQSSGGAAA